MAAKRLEFLDRSYILSAIPESLQLASSILDAGLVPRKAAEDAAHLAIATVHGMDYLLSWNCRHIANASLQKRFYRVCADAGYELPVICTPHELLGE